VIQFYGDNLAVDSVLLLPPKIAKILCAVPHGVTHTCKSTKLFRGDRHVPGERRSPFKFATEFAVGFRVLTHAYARRDASKVKVVMPQSDLRLLVISKQTVRMLKHVQVPQELVVAMQQVIGIGLTREE
jgi:hypothetical protein